MNSTNQLFQLSDSVFLLNWFGALNHQCFLPHIWLDSLLISFLDDFDELAGTECKACTPKQAMYRLSSASFWGWRSNWKLKGFRVWLVNWQSYSFWHRIWSSEFETRWIDISWHFNFWVSPKPAGFTLFFPGFLVGFQPWGFACLSSWFLLEFLGSPCNGHRTVDQAKLGHERHERQWVSERSEADTELGPSSWSGEIFFGRLYSWRKQMGEWVSMEEQNLKVLKISERKGIHEPSEVHGTPHFFL